MELSFNELKKRDVVNITDGKCFGKITDLTLSFPKGLLTGITVPANKKNCIMRLFDRNKIFIEERKILRIGNDVILVDLKCGDVCDESVKVGTGKPAPPKFPEIPPCSSFCQSENCNKVSDEYDEY